jgi:hypothetical protein
MWVKNESAKTTSKVSVTPSCSGAADDGQARQPICCRNCTASSCVAREHVDLRDGVAPVAREAAVAGCKFQHREGTRGCAEFAEQPADEVCSVRAALKVIAERGDLVRGVWIVVVPSEDIVGRVDLG